MMQIEVASLSEVGARSHNEDDWRQGVSGTQVYAVLSDGAGGHSNGAMASDIVVRTATLALQRTSVFNAAVLEAAMEEANIVLNAGQQGFKSHQRMHATVVALWLDAQAGLALWAHVGDSRLYRIRQGMAQQLTSDDSVVQQMVDAGFIKPEDAKHHPRKNQLLAAMGSEETPHVHVCGTPEALLDGDAYLLCSDGWWDQLTPGDIERTLRASGDTQQWLAHMARIVAAANVPNQDNYTAVALWVGNPHEVTRVGA
ncbi:MAG: protein phosphatase 2C domain-containing protein [Aquabacterium sp.]|nr:protein phosphatase 2C domain-containing protein [Aquabacterium sp.]